MNNIKWIFKRGAKSHEWYAFKKDIHIEDFNETTIEISSLGRYILYINGKYVARGPVRSFDFAKYYDSIDITAFLNAGKNTVLILSQYLLHEGVYCRICANGQPLCITDESWLAKKYESLDSTTNVCAPPLEPVRCNEECFDARIDEKEKIFSSDNNGWEYADYVHGEFNRITPNLGGLCSEEMAFASKFMGAVSICEKERFGFRIRNLKRQPNPVRKTYSELYVFIVSSESEKDVEFLSNATVSVNGASSKNIAHLKKGDNLFAIYSCKVGVDASVVFRESVCIKDINFNEGSAKAGVMMLEQDSRYFGWAYPDAEQYKDDNGQEIINEVLYATELNDISHLLGSFLPTELGELDVALTIKDVEYGKIVGSGIDPSLMLPITFNSADCGIEKPIHILNANADYATIKGDVAFFLDFGVEKLGHIDFCLCADEGTVIEMEGFEVVDFNGMHHVPLNCMRYICKQGWQSYTSVNPRGFRYLYVVIKNAKNPVKIRHIGVVNSIAMTPSGGGFFCDNEMLNKIYEMCINTARLCMSDAYLDCPGYEQVYWLLDAKFTAEVNMLNFGNYAFDYRCLELISESLFEDYIKFYRNDKMYTENKYLPLGSFGSYVYGGLPLWSFLWALQIGDYYLYSGDVEGTKKLFVALKKMLSNCENMMSERGLFAMEGAWNLIDWAQNDVLPCGEITVNSAFLAKLYNMTAHFATEFGEEEYAVFCANKSKEIIDAINKYCWNEELCSYVDTVRDEFGYELYVKFFKEQGLEYDSYEEYLSYTRISEHANLIAYNCGCVPENRKEYVHNVARKVVKDDYRHLHSCPNDNRLRTDRKIEEMVPIGSPYMLYYFFDVLCDMGKHEDVLKTIIRIYSKMIECGTNTCWETFYNEGDSEWTRSVCHGWGASPAIYLQTEICGIKPVKPGFKEFTFTPHTAGLKKIKTEVPTPYGSIYVNIDTENDICDISYPDECRLVK